MHFHAFQARQSQEETSRRIAWLFRTACCSGVTVSNRTVIQRDVTATYVCPVIVIERVELLPGELVLQLESMVVREGVCELVERVGVAGVRFEGSF